MAVIGITNKFLTALRSPPDKNDICLALWGKWNRVTRQNWEGGTDSEILVLSYQRLVGIYSAPNLVPLPKHLTTTTPPHEGHDL